MCNMYGQKFNWKIKILYSGKTTNASSLYFGFFILFFYLLDNRLQLLQKLEFAKWLVKCVDFVAIGVYYWVYY